MSDLVTSLQAETIPALTTLGSDLADDFLGGMQEILANADQAARDKVAGLIKEGFAFKAKALGAETVELARDYAEAVEKTQRRVKTVLLAESIVAQESTAALIADLFGKAMSALGTIAKGLITTIASGIVKGAIAGVVGGEGGDGFDPSAIFPNA